MTGIGTLPTRLLLQPAKQSIVDLQKKLSALQLEAASGRHADIGLALGGKISDSVRLRSQLAAIDRQRDDLKQISTIADITQTSLTSLGKLTNDFRSTLTGSRNSEGGRTIGTQAAEASLQSFKGILSVSHNGQYLFSGLNTDTTPLKDYNSGARDAVITAFSDLFGFSPDDPSASDVTSDQLVNFINHEMRDLFTGEGWETNWSAATTSGLTFRISGSEFANVQSTINSSFAQKIAQSLSVIEVFGSSEINQSAFEGAVDAALSLISEGQMMVGNEQARIGIGERSIKSVDDRLSVQKAYVAKSVQDLEGVDSFETATRANILMTSLESSYALTTRLSRMSILSYIG